MKRPNEYSTPLIIDNMEALIPFIGLILRIWITVYCVRRAERLNRSQFGWGIFAFFIPLVAVIWIQFMKPIIDWENPESVE